MWIVSINGEESLFTAKDEVMSYIDKTIKEDTDARVTLKKMASKEIWQVKYFKSTDIKVEYFDSKLEAVNFIINNDFDKYVIKKTWKITSMSYSNE